jgi:DNA-binding MarR family transcriptional regulator
MQKSTDELAELTLDCFAFSSRRSARAVTNYLNALLKPLDLTTAQFGLMAALRKHPGRSLRDLSVGLLLDESTMTRNLAVLERRALVDAEGGRGRGGKRVSLTAAGIDLFDDAVVGWRRANEAIAAEMDPVLVEQGRRFLLALTRAAEKLGAEYAQRAEGEPILLGDGVD